jgi:hypothetical protein
MVRIMAVGLIAAFVASPAFAKVPKGCRGDSGQQADQTGECSNIIIENLDRGTSSTSHYYHSTPHHSRKHKATHKPTTSNLPATNRN